MTSIDGARRELKRLREKLLRDERDFRSASPPVDAEGLPEWPGYDPLTIEQFNRALGFGTEVPDEDLNDAELATRHRLAKYKPIFLKMADEKAGGEDVTT